jgi:hypothetical protein
MARPQVDLVKGGFGRQVEAAGRHEPEGAADLGRDLRVAATLDARGHELLVPDVHLGQVGEAAFGERPQQVHRRRRLVVGGDQPCRVGYAGLEGGRGVVHAVAAEGGDDVVAHHLRRR